MTRKAHLRTYDRQARRLLAGRRPAGIEPLEPRAMLASISGTVQQALDAVGLDPNDPDAFAPVASVTVVLDDGTRQPVHGLAPPA